MSINHETTLRSTAKLKHYLTRILGYICAKTNDMWWIKKNEGPYYEELFRVTFKLKFKKKHLSLRDLLNGSAVLGNF